MPYTPTENYYRAAIEDAHQDGTPFNIVVRANRLAETGAQFFAYLAAHNAAVEAKLDLDVIVNTNSKRTRP